MVAASNDNNVASDDQTWKILKYSGKRYERGYGCWFLQGSWELFKFKMYILFIWNNTSLLNWHHLVIIGRSFNQFWLMKAAKSPRLRNCNGCFFCVANLTFYMSADDNRASDNNDVASDNADELLRIWGYPASSLLPSWWEHLPTWSGIRLPWNRASKL